MDTTRSDASHHHDRPANRLAGETSPYLLQHATNPVDWYPWGSEALARSKAENKPIFLSIGYSACHWCHVMERESFENPAIAALMNEHFVNIKVDREERPDLDQIYMSAVMAMTGHGGWPMSVFLTPELKPFFGGTYFPPTDSRGMAGFSARAVERASGLAGTTGRDHRVGGRDDASSCVRSATLPPRVGRARHQAARPGGSHDDARASTRCTAASATPPSFRTRWTSRCSCAITREPATARRCTWSGTRSTRWPAAAFTTTWAAASPATRPTTAGWSPTSRKCSTTMRFLTSVYLEAYQATRDADFARVARETMDYVLGRMTDPEGAFLLDRGRRQRGRRRASTTSGRSPKSPRFWARIAAKTFCYVYDVTEQGNWEEHNILNLPRTISQAAKLLERDEDELRAELAASRAKLLAVREGRVPPAKDTKVLVSWNGLMIAALAEGGRILKDERYLEAARPGRRVYPRPHATRRRPLAPHLQGRPGQARRLSRRLCRPDRRPDAAVRSDRRTALDRLGPRAGPDHDRRVRRRGAGGVLLHRQSPRGPDRAAERRARQCDPVGQRHGRDGPDPARSIDRPRRPDPGRPKCTRIGSSRARDASRPPPARA